MFYYFLQNVVVYLLTLDLAMQHFSRSTLMIALVSVVHSHTVDVRATTIDLTLRLVAIKPVVRTEENIRSLPQVRKLYLLRTCVL